MEKFVLLRTPHPPQAVPLPPLGKASVNRAFGQQTEVYFVTATSSDDHMASLQVFFENIVVAPTVRYIFVI